MITVRDKDNLKGKLRELAELRDLQEAVKINTSELQKKAMRRVPVDTGNLKRSINMEFKDGGLTGVVKAETDYSAYVEFGTRFMNSQPYLRPSLFEQTVQFRRDLFRIMK